MLINIYKVDNLLDEFDKKGTINNEKLLSEFKEIIIKICINPTKRKDCIERDLFINNILNKLYTNKNYISGVFYLDPRGLSIKNKIRSYKGFLSKEFKNEKNIEIEFDINAQESVFFAHISYSKSVESFIFTNFPYHKYGFSYFNDKEIIFNKDTLSILFETIYNKKINGINIINVLNIFKEHKKMFFLRLTGNMDDEMCFQIITNKDNNFDSILDEDYILKQLK